MVGNCIMFAISMIMSGCFHMGIKYGPPCSAGIAYHILGIVGAIVLLVPNHFSWIGFEVTNWYIVLIGTITYAIACIIKYAISSCYKSYKK